MNKTILNLFLSCCLILFMASCGSGDGGEDSAPQLSNAILESETLVPSLQIVREGQALPLQNILGAHVGDEIALATLNSSSAVYWVTLDPFAAYFTSPGRLKLLAPGRFYIAAFSSSQSDYVVVESLERIGSADPIPEENTSFTPSAPITPPTPAEPDTPPTVCVATTCEQEGKNCGVISDGCGEQLECGECLNSGESCGVLTVNVCGRIEPSSPVSTRPPSVESDSFIDEVVSFTSGSGGSGDTLENRARVLGPPRGCGLSCGSVDVLSLGVRGEIVVRSTTPIFNEAGVDFIVFENAFFAGGNPMGLLFAELGEVAVSQNGTDFTAFTCDFSNRVMLYPGCAGAHPIFANADSNMLSPTDYRLSGGDGFDLQDLGLDWIQYIRIRDLATVGGSGFDLDAIAIVHQ